MISLSACAQNQGIDTDRMLMHLRTLSSDQMQGREAGTEGGAMAREYVLREFRSTGIQPCGQDFLHPFSFQRRGADEVTESVNIVGFVQGTSDSLDRIVVSAHYDHIGVRNGEIYNGADDNASGTSVLIELARYFAANPPEHTIVFAAFDAEEKGLRGARAFLESECATRAPISLNINMDMVSRSDKNELYATGTYHYPYLKPYIESVMRHESLNLMFGHDLPGTGSDDWTSASDHGPFHAAGIPFVYFGVEDHAGYHQPTDDFELITEPFFREVGEFIRKVVISADVFLDDIVSAKQ